MSSTLRRLLTSSVGLKVTMALTGVVLVGFVIAHFTGNLLIYAGEEALDAYGHFIQEGTHGAIWLLRAVLLVSVVLHVWAAVVLAQRSNSARPTGYAAGRKRQRATYASLTMRYGGPALLLFIIYHLAHFTTGWAHPDWEYGAVYDNVVIGFSDPVVSGIYIAAMVFLGLHLYHGIASGLQTVGLATTESRWPFRLSGLIALVVAGGNILFPVSVLTGIVE